MAGGRFLVFIANIRGMALQQMIGRDETETSPLNNCLFSVAE
jgi:hypothetical protein